ncbi:hypothetical protein Q4E93_27900 [Flavitalea sp. BT771]|uniref:hypothetical protein n=1 Tax=Flavitalea sp. BT771 TaxID=3063329 RepID=UPI0026E3FCEA|nr:hypothetical protein [Flavitalea sp. BT771]MDO6434467.1 hypothetical protein [Flavitalea sp. BT771]MDV6223367.1 hypothetical protein [Flavitalea sp. BT771]
MSQETQYLRQMPEELKKRDSREVDAGKMSGIKMGTLTTRNRQQKKLIAFLGDNMKYIIVLIFLCPSLRSNAQTGTGLNNDSLDLLFKHHFRILDSAILKKTVSRYYCCTAQINFMENRTRIISSSEKSFMGKLSFTIQDVIKWHQWYIKRSVLTTSE